MLYFTNKPDPAFQEIVKTCLECAIDEVRDFSDEDHVVGFSDKIQSIFTKDQLLAEIKRLLEVHLSDDLYKVSDYHFLILHDLISRDIEIHNENIRSEEQGYLGNIEVWHIDFEEIESIYFWDRDFFVPSDYYNNIEPEAKKVMDFSKETFGIIHDMQPHPDELILEKFEIPKWWQAPDIYKPGELYPFYPEND